MKRFIGPLIVVLALSSCATVEYIRPNPKLEKLQSPKIVGIVMKDRTFLVQSRKAVLTGIFLSGAIGGAISSSGGQNSSAAGAAVALGGGLATFYRGDTSFKEKLKQVQYPFPDLVVMGEVSKYFSKEFNTSIDDFLYDDSPTYVSPVEVWKQQRPHAQLFLFVAPLRGPTFRIGLIYGPGLGYDIQQGLRAELINPEGEILWSGVCVASASAIEGHFFDADAVNPSFMRFLLTYQPKVNDRCLQQLIDQWENPSEEKKIQLTSVFSHTLTAKKCPQEGCFVEYIK